MSNMVNLMNTRIKLLSTIFSASILSGCFTAEIAATADPLPSELEPSINITNGNRAPVAYNDQHIVQKDASITTILKASDKEGDALVYSIHQPAEKGLVVMLDATKGEFSYIPNPGMSGSDTFNFMVNDGKDSSNIGTINISITDTAPAPVVVVPNVAPVALDMSIVGAEDAKLASKFDASDFEGDSLSYVIVKNPTKGTVTASGDGFNYTPDANSFGTDSFSYKVTDGTDESNIATVTLNISAVNDLPVAKVDTVFTDEDVSFLISDVTTNDTDPDGDVLTVASFTQPSNGTIEARSGNRFRYTPRADYNGIDQFSYTVTDGNGGSSTANINVQVYSVNDSPSAVSDSATVSQGGNTKISVLDNDSGLGDTPLTIDISTQPTNGTASIDPSGMLTYAPNSGFFGTESVSYSISDKDGDTSIATASFTVNCTLSDCTKPMNLSWTASESNDVTGYKVYVGNSAGTYTETYNVGNKTVYDYIAKQKGTFYFSVTAVNANSVESDYSNEVNALF